MSQAAVARRVPLAVPVAIAVAWAVSITANAVGRTDLLSHDAIAGGALPLPVGVVAFAVAWTVMVAAMMLPSTIPMVRLFAGASAAQPDHSRVMTAFVGGYVALWALFGVGALAFDLGVHAAVDALPWLEERSFLLGAGVLALAGAFQFTDLKDRCLDQCRHPAAFLIPRYRRGVAAAWSLGTDHGLFCMGCCWALMLLMFSAGVTDLRWMAALTLLMAYEKLGRHGVAVGRAAGVVLLGAAVVVLGVGLS